jgi:hypothetical protein
VYLIAKNLAELKTSASLSTLPEIVSPDVSKVQYKSDPCLIKTTATTYGCPKPPSLPHDLWHFHHGDTGSFLIIENAQSTHEIGNFGSMNLGNAGHL